MALCDKLFSTEGTYMLVNVFQTLMEYNNRNIFLKKSCRKRDRDKSSILFLLFEKALYKFKESALQLSFNIVLTFREPSTCHTIKKKLQTIDPELCLIFVHQNLFIIFQQKCF